MSLRVIFFLLIILYLSISHWNNFLCVIYVNFLLIKINFIQITNHSIIDFLRIRKREKIYKNLQNLFFLFFLFLPNNPPTFHLFSPIFFMFFLKKREKIGVRKEKKNWITFLNNTKITFEVLFFLKKHFSLFSKIFFRPKDI